MSYRNWQQRLAKQPVKAFVTPTLDDEGYYRKPITEKEIGANGKTNGRTRVIGWTPVAYFSEGDKLTCLIGAAPAIKEVDAADEALWSWVVEHPIPYDWYKAVAEDGGEWPDKPQPPVLSENVGSVEHAAPKPLETAEDFKAAIVTAIGATVDAKVDTDEDANAVNGSINRIAELRLGAAKAGEAAYKPHYARYKAAFDLWTPMVKDAELEEKRLARLILAHRERVRQRELVEEQKRKVAEEAAAEAAARAADRAISNGEPPALAEAPETEEALPPPPPPSRLTPTYGKRKVKEQMQTFVEITDIDKVFAYFRDSAEVKAVLSTLALVAVKAGRDVPGITKREGLV